MPELVWDEIDFLDCLEVMPEVEEFGISHVYEVAKQGLVLKVVVWQLESLIHLSLHREGVEAPLTEMTLCVRDAVRYIKDKRGVYLEFPDCIIMADSNFWTVGDVFDKAKFHYGLTVQLAVKPDIRIRHQLV